MKKYDKYKDSGIEWIGEIPEHWDDVSVKWISHIFSGGTPSKDKEEYWFNGTIPWLNSGTVNQGQITEPSELITELGFEKSSAKWIPKDALVMALAGQGKTKGMVAQLAIDATCNQSMAAIIPQREVQARYLLYWLQSNYQNIRNLGGGDLRDGLNLDMIGSIKSPIPNEKEQTAIAAYLDRKTAEIDELIADKKRLHALYEEEKTALINQAVTGKAAIYGSSTHVPMKDSGIEWLGEIPEHWEVRRLSWCFEIIGSGTTPKAGSEEYYYNGEFNWLLTGDLTDGEIFETSKKVTQKALDEHSSLKKYPVNSIVMAMYGATIGKLGILKIPTTVNQACCVMGNPIHLQYQFAFYLLLAARKEIINMSYGGGQPNISQELIKSFRVQVPPLKEQQSIVRHIETECALIDAKKAKTEQLIKLLTEYRTALISEVVTGKIKVID